VLEEACSSRVLKEQTIVFIPNTLSTDYRLRAKLNRPARKHNQFTIGVASLNKSDLLKGSDIIEEIRAHYLRDPFIDFSYLNDFSSEDYEEFWGSISCLLVPSRGDNSPNVIHEAKLRGIPVVASDVGGISELLHQGYDFRVEKDKLCLAGFVEGLDTMRKREFTDRDKELMLESFNSYTENSMNSLIVTYENLIEKCFK
jgi:glycosyltransferase involved in cell wall biosynthesis